MGVADDFKTFCGNLAVINRDSIAVRAGRITRRLNIEFWDLESETQHRLYVGSFGRDTATGETSDVDLLVRLPYATYKTYADYQGNGQSALLQAVRVALQKTYPSTSIGADGQVVVVRFNDNLTFETLPAFRNKDESFTYPDANNGGSWKVTNPRPEIAEINRMDTACNGNLKCLCKMARAWKDFWDVPIGGLLIDTLAYQFIRDYEYRDKSYLYYDYMSRDFFDFLRLQDEDQERWLSPGAGQYVQRTGKFEYKATRCRNIAVEACEYQNDSYGWAARQKWREIYGGRFPG